MHLYVWYISSTTHYYCHRYNYFKTMTDEEIKLQKIDSSLDCFKKVDNVCIEIEVKKNNAHVSCLGEKSYMIFKNGAERKVRNPYDL